MEGQNTVSAYFTSTQILPFGFAEQKRPRVQIELSTFPCALTIAHVKMDNVKQVCLEASTPLYKAGRQLLTCKVSSYCRFASAKPEGINSLLAKKAVTAFWLRTA